MTSQFSLSQIYRRRRLDLGRLRLPVPLRAGLAATAAMLVLRGLGLLQPFELKALDAFIFLRPVEQPDQRIVIVGVNEADLNWIGKSVVSDELLAQMIELIRDQKPRAIGMDFYRNTPVEPGLARLADVFENTPNLIGIEKVIVDEGPSRQDAALPGNDILATADRLAASDVVVDHDGRVRRGLVFPATEGPRILEGLGTRMALDYLAAEGLYPNPKAENLEINGVQIKPVESNTGGYVRLHSGGYQVMLDPRRTAQPVEHISVRDLLTGNVASDRMKDRIVLIGSTAPSAADLFYTSHGNGHFRDTQITFGVELHAEMASQILSQVLDGRPGLHSLPEVGEILNIALLALGIAAIQAGLEGQKRHLGLGAMLLGTPLIHYGAFVVWGLWLPLIPSLGAMGLASLLVTLNRSNEFKTLSEKDGLTRLANRRIFDETLQREWMGALRSLQPLSLIICDVDYFKRYNDTYGHSQGDDCLRQVAQVIQTVANYGTGLAARYGGEEFVLLMPNARVEQALALANQIRERLVALQLPHEASEIANHVTLSLGVATLQPTMNLPMGALVEQADLALYAAKQAGRNQAQVYHPMMEKGEEKSPKLA
jgi:adenylate cyclase